MTTPHLEDLTHQLKETLERRGDTCRIISAIGEALATVTLPEFTDGDTDEFVRFSWEPEEAYAE